ncbi:MAG: MnmC family methyltransferase [Cyanobacteriota bacterium]|nr:MnmC family methyltransferase [Cyanobacteriota bacterium]
MTSPAYGAETPAALVHGRGEGTTGLALRSGADGSFSLWSEAFGEGFHSGRGALREAQETFLAPSQLERFQPGERLRVVEVCVGTGTNLALLLEACAARGLALEWWGLELDPRPLALALATPEFRRPWQPATLTVLERLREQGRWQSHRASARLLWGDARQTLAELLMERRGQVELVWHDAFSPRRCPQLWTVELLGAVTALLTPTGRWISYSSAAAVRETLRLRGLRVVALESREAGEKAAAAFAGGVSGWAPARRMAWSGGTLASPTGLGAPSCGVTSLWRELTGMERDHLASSAGEPYRDPSGSGDAATILACRQAAQAEALASGRRASSSAWRQRWGVGRQDREQRGPPGACRPGIER